MRVQRYISSILSFKNFWFTSRLFKESENIKPPESFYLEHYLKLFEVNLKDFKFSILFSIFIISLIEFSPIFFIAPRPNEIDLLPFS